MKQVQQLYGVLICGTRELASSYGVPILFVSKAAARGYAFGGLTPKECKDFKVVKVTQTLEWEEPKP